MSDYTAVLHAKTRAVVPIDEILQISIPSTETGRIVTADFQTDWAKVNDYDSLVPRHLLIECRGEADSLNEFLASSFSAAHGLFPYIAVAANAAVEDPMYDVIYDSSPGATEREIASFYLPETSSLPLFVREIPLKETFALVSAVDKHSERERLFRAITQYQLALSHWKPGDDNRAMAHLWMGMEALTKVALQHYCREKGIDASNLAGHLNVDQDRVEATIRKVVLFKDDGSTHRKAKLARNGWSHSFERFDRVRAAASSARLKTAHYLRSAILELAGLSTDTKMRLSEPSYQGPLWNGDTLLTVRGIVTGSSETLAPEGRLHPSAGLQFNIQNYKQSGNGGYELAISQSFEPEVAEGLTLQSPVVRITFPTPDMG